MEPDSVAMLEAQWGSLRLTEEERETIEVLEDFLERDRIKGHHSVIGRLNRLRGGEECYPNYNGKGLESEQTSHFYGSWEKYIHYCFRNNYG